ncbi:hypothetical protein ACIXT0_11050 [Bacteroides fragilis]
MKKGGNGLVHLSLPIKSTHLAEPNKKNNKVLTLLHCKSMKKKLIAVILCN